MVRGLCFLCVPVSHGVCFGKLCCSVRFEIEQFLNYPTLTNYARTDAQRATEKKKRKDKEIELLALGVDNDELEDQDDLKVTQLLYISI